jgi:2-oxo-4-hydroxy-4-carboxy--5-ureidoimidazoline (OHCU) decarboxylase
VSPVPGAAVLDDVGALDAMLARDFTAAMAPLFEGAPRFLDRLAAARPFGSLEALFDRARQIAHAMPVADQIELIDAHPRLGAAAATVSALSFREQGYATTPRADSAPADPGDVAAALERLNDAYEARFGFRYCVFVAGRPRHALVGELEAALERDRADELHRALDAVVDIAIDRRGKLVAEATR